MRHVEELAEYAEPMILAANEWTSFHPGATNYINELLRNNKRAVVFCSQAAWIFNHMFGLGSLKPEDDVDLIVSPEDYDYAGASLDDATIEDLVSVRSQFYCHEPGCSEPCAQTNCGNIMEFDVGITRGNAGEDRIEFMYPYNDITATYNGQKVSYSWYPTDTIFDNGFLIPVSEGRNIAIAHPIDTIIMYAIRRSVKKYDKEKTWSLHCMANQLRQYCEDYRDIRYKEVNVDDRIKRFVNEATLAGLARFISNLDNAEFTAELVEARSRAIGSLPIIRPEYVEFPNLIS